MATESSQLSYHLEFDPNEIQSSILPTATPDDFLVVQDVNRVVSDYIQRGSIVFNEIKSAANMPFRQHHLYFIEGGPYYQFTMIFHTIITIHSIFCFYNSQYIRIDSLCGAFFVQNKVSPHIKEMNLDLCIYKKLLKLLSACFK